jgi:hypothetical protein
MNAAVKEDSISLNGARVLVFPMAVLTGRSWRQMV